MPGGKAPQPRLLRQPPFPLAEAASRSILPPALDAGVRMQAERGLMAAIHASPQQAAQRRRLAHMFGRDAEAPPPTQAGLPERLGAGVEALSGVSMQNVRVHYNSSRPAQLQAAAFAQGADIHIAPGQEHALPHEAWHVAQQAQGRVRPTGRLAGHVVNDDSALEREADVMGAKAASAAPPMAGAATAFGADPPAPVIAQRLKVDKEVVPFDDSLPPATAREYLVRLERGDKAIEVKDDQEWYELAKRAVADTEEARRVLAARAWLNFARERAGGVALLRQRAATIEARAAAGIAAADAVDAKGWRLAAAKRQWSLLEPELIKACNKQLNELQHAQGDIRRIGYSVGLPAFDADTLADFNRLEGKKGEARGVRRPIDAIFKKYAEELAGKIPGAMLGYRGSLARGVKSPSKYVMAAGGPALAMFNSQGAKRADPRLLRAADTAGFDIDANVVLPAEFFGRDIQGGPIANSSPANPTIRILVEMQDRMGREIGAAGVQGYAAGPGFEFYISSARRAQGQLRSGTPYPKAMLENANMPGFARTLPQFWSRELVNKVKEYAVSRIVWKDEDVYYLPPLVERYWDPYFLRLYEAIKAEGPLAVAMPDVQVLFEDSKKSELTEIAEPYSDAEYRGPVDLLAQKFGFAFTNPERQPQVGDFYVGRVSAKETGQKGRSKVFIAASAIEFLDLGDGARRYDEGVDVLVCVTHLPRNARETYRATIRKRVE